jgi:hypothetical protein
MIRELLRWGVKKNKLRVFENRRPENIERKSGLQASAPAVVQMMVLAFSCQHVQWNLSQTVPCYNVNMHVAEKFYDPEWKRREMKWCAVCWLVLWEVFCFEM